MITVIGMHRSGTSALAGALHKLGADLGPKSSWIQPAADNPRGFFEYLPVVELDGEILMALGGTWATPPALPPGWVESETLAGPRERAERLASEIPRAMIVKDPRLSLVQPLWEWVGTVPATISCVRHPVAVANSLRARNHFDLDVGLFLWFRYNAAALVNCPEAVRVEYESLLSDPSPQLRRVADYIELEVTEQMLEIASGTVYRDMAHHQVEPIPDTPIGQVCSRFYELLKSNDGLRGDPDMARWASLVTELPWAGAGDREVNRARRDVEELKYELARAEKENQALKTRLHRLESELRNMSMTLDTVHITRTAEQLLSPEGTS